jgi:hypothetical protein
MTERVPAYAMAPLKAFLKYLASTMQLLNVSMQGISVLIGMPAFVELLAVPLRATLTHDWKEEEYEASLTKAREAAAFAEAESKAGFPFFHEFVLVGLWGAMEAMVEDLVVALISNEPVLLGNEHFSKIKIPLADYEQLDGEHRMRFLVTELQRTLRTTQRQGINAFEPLLDCVGLSGEVNEPAKKSFWEMNHLRNVIVHRRSLADRTFIDACPWFALKIGERISITAENMDRYPTMLAGYGLDMVYRMAKRFDVEMPPKEDLA